MNSRRFAYSTPPEVEIIESGEMARDVFGHRYGSQVMKLDNNLLEALQRGKQLAISICDEYVIFVEPEFLPKAEQNECAAKNTTVFEKIKSGLEEAIEFERGERLPASLCLRSERSKEGRKTELSFANAYKWVRLCYRGPERVKALLCELKYAWQRAWYGFDDRDISDLGQHEIRRIKVLLREFRRAQTDSFSLRDPETKRIYSGEEVDALLNEMIFLFENCDVLRTYQRLHGVLMWKDEADDVEERAKAADKESDRCREEAFKLFAKWCMHLWQI